MVKTCAVRARTGVVYSPEENSRLQRPAGQAIVQCLEATQLVTLLVELLAYAVHCYFLLEGRRVTFLALQRAYFTEQAFD